MDKYLTDEQYKDWSQCGFCNGRGHHPTRATLHCKACDGRGRVPWKAEDKPDKATINGPHGGHNQRTNIMSTQAGPFSAPEGSAPKTYKVTITTVIPMVNTDPIEWDLRALLETVADHHWLEVETVEMTEVTS